MNFRLPNEILPQMSVPQSSTFNPLSPIMIEPAWAAEPASRASVATMQSVFIASIPLRVRLKTRGDKPKGAAPGDM
jgi:hypothetical protein